MLLYYVYITRVKQYMTMTCSELLSVVVSPTEKKHDKIVYLVQEKLSDSDHVIGTNKKINIWFATLSDVITGSLPVECSYVRTKQT